MCRNGYRNERGIYCIECVVVVSLILNAECGIETAGQPLYPLMGGDMLTLSYTPSLHIPVQCPAVTLM